MKPIMERYTEGEFTWFGLDFLSHYADHDKCNYVLDSCAKEVVLFMRLKDMLRRT